MLTSNPQFARAAVNLFWAELDQLAFVRSVEAWESAHARAQYYLQVGHSFSPARRKEMPSVGAVIAYEMQAKRKESDFLPPFVTMNFGNSQAGLVREGCLESRYGPLPLDTQQGNGFVIPDAGCRTRLPYTRS